MISIIFSFMSFAAAADTPSLACELKIKNQLVSCSEIFAEAKAKKKIDDFQRKMMCESLKMNAGSSVAVARLIERLKVGPDDLQVVAAKQCPAPGRLKNICKAQHPARMIYLYTNKLGFTKADLIEDEKFCKQMNL